MRPVMPLGLTSEEAVRWQTCESKRAFVYLFEARLAAKNTNPGITVYRCRYGRHWHVGHDRKRTS